ISTSLRCEPSNTPEAAAKFGAETLPLLARIMMSAVLAEIVIVCPMIRAFELFTDRNWTPLPFQVLPRKIVPVDEAATLSKLTDSAAAGRPAPMVRIAAARTAGNDLRMTRPPRGRRGGGRAQEDRPREGRSLRGTSGFLQSLGFSARRRRTEP